jgi:hypothetical protein
MSDFEINIDDLGDSRSITSALKRSYYPDNQQIIKKTSYSEDPNNYNRNLMSRDPVKVMQGDGLYRNPAFAVAGYEQNTQAAMHTVLAMGADIDDTVKVPDPSDPTKALSGAQARMEIARKSFMSTGFAPTGFESAMRAFTASSISELTGSSGSAGGSGGEIEHAEGSVPHGTKGYEVSDGAQVYNGANRAIALESEMTEDEKAIFREKADLLLNKANIKIHDTSMLQGGTMINFNINPKGQDLTKLGFQINMAGSYMDRGGTFKYERVDIAPYLGTGERRAYPAAALIELLSRLTDKIFIRGGFGLGRGIIGGNFTELTATNNYITDHAFARAFDIRVVDTVDVEVSPPANVYRQALDILLTNIEALPQELHPDQIGISDQLVTELGLAERGLEEANVTVRTNHPNLGKFVDFTYDSNHRDHIHISFGSKRAGAFLPPYDASKEATAPPADSNINIGTSISDPSSLLTKFKKSYKTTTAPFGEGSLSQIEIFYLLNSYGNFGPQLSAIFAELAYRESRCNPWSTNDSGFVGLWQLGTRTNSGGLVKVTLTIPSTETVDMWTLAYLPWKFAGLTVDKADDIIRNIQKGDPTGNAGRAYWDPRAFIPLNQIAMLRAKFNRPDIANDRIEAIGRKSSQSVLYPWGDGFLEHGWLSGLNYERLRTIYQQGTGDKPENLDAWILFTVNGDSATREVDPENNRPKLQNWVQDFKYYDIIYL